MTNDHGAPMSEAPRDRPILVMWRHWYPHPIVAQWIDGMWTAGIFGGDPTDPGPTWWWYLPDTEGVP